MSQVKGAINFLLENSLFLIIGAVIGLAWANMNPEVNEDGQDVPTASYAHLVHLKILENHWIGELQKKDSHPGGIGSAAAPEHADKLDSTKKDDHEKTQRPLRIITLHWLINDLLMALFFAIAGKEVWEATLPGGPLNDPKKAATPLVATLGGMAGPALLYIAGVAYLDQMDLYANGWAIPCATDIAFSYMVARIVFGAGHPAIPFLLLLAIADDALGLVILAVFYPQEEVRLIWLLLPVGGMALAYAMSRKKIHSFWPYLLGPGIISWFGFTQSGIHPALGLLPIIPMLPHAHVDEGLFDWKEMDKHDTLNEFEHWWKNPVELILGLFGLLNAGVVMSAVGDPTWLVLAGLLIGKPLGIWVCGMFTASVLGCGLPDGMTSKDVFVLGCAAGIGFTVALFVATVAFETGPIQDAAKMGALASFAAAIITVIAGKVMGVVKVDGSGPAEEHGH